MSTSIYVRDVRSFAGTHRVVIRPLTFVVGDNSSGKSTLLALVNALHQGWRFPTHLALSEAPFDLGGYDSIVTRHLGRQGIPKSFAIGGEINLTGFGKAETVATYVAGAFEQPQLQKLEFVKPPFRLTISVPINKQKASISISDVEDDRVLYSSTDHNESVAAIKSDPYAWMHILYGSRPWIEALRQSGKVSPEIAAFFESLSTKVPDIFQPRRVVALAPIRSEVKRTYERYAPQSDPAGGHVPLILASVLEQADEEEDKQRFLQRIHEFSVDANLFREISVRSLGERGADPFQIMVRNGNVAFNLVDVGYGVNQSLPIAVESIRSPRESMLLLQQPEVHLHPRAQAALGSMFVRLRRDDAKSFVIETHSDYIIDRVRTHIAHGDIPATDVGILFLHCVNGATKVHSMDIDGRGNIERAPAEYREFFMQEQDRLLNR